MRLLKTSKLEPWPERLKDTKPGQILNVELGSAASCRQAISRSLPYSGCTFEFDTKTKKKKMPKKVIKYLEVIRTS